MTTHDRYDVLWPSGGPGGVVYEIGGRIDRFDPATGRTNEVAIRIAGDLRRTVPYVKAVKSEIQSMNVSPTARRAIVEAHGDIFTAPAREGEIRNLTATPGIRETGPSWSPDGQWVAYLSRSLRRVPDLYQARRMARAKSAASHVMATPGASPRSGHQIPNTCCSATSGSACASPTPPRGKTIDVDRGSSTDLTSYYVVARQPLGGVRQGGARDEADGDLGVLASRKARPHQLTSGNAADVEPVFDPKGRYLYFLSNRDFNLTFSGYEFNYRLRRLDARLRRDCSRRTARRLLLPRSDEEPRRESEALRAPSPPGQKPAIPPAKPQPERREAEPPQGQSREQPAAPAPAPAAGPDASTPAAVRVTIDVDGFEQRVRAIPGAPADHRSLSASRSRRAVPRGSGRSDARW